MTAILNLGWLTSAPIWWITLLSGNIVSAGLGFMLGFSVINKLFLAKNDAAKAKLEELRVKIAAKHGELGILGLIVGIWMLVVSFMFAVV